MEQWEYFTEFVKADINGPGVREYLEENVPNWTDPPKYIPQCMIPYLNLRGREGWEMVHIQPVKVGTNYDVLLHSQVSEWSHAYFCAFKRRLPG